MPLGRQQDVTNIELNGFLLLRGKADMAGTQLVGSWMHACSMGFYLLSPGLSLDSTN